MEDQNLKKENELNFSNKPIQPTTNPQNIQNLHITNRNLFQAR
jgi:hypothetical protein